MESQASLSPVTVGSVVATKSSASTFAFEYQHSSTSSSHSIGVGSQLTEPEFSSYGTEPQELSVFTDSRVSPSEPTPTFTSQPTTPALHLPYVYGNVLPGTGPSFFRPPPAHRRRPSADLPFAPRGPFFCRCRHPEVSQDFFFFGKRARPPRRWAMAMARNSGMGFTRSLFRWTPIRRATTVNMYKHPGGTRV